MFDKIGQLAEMMATGVGMSRRGFLGRLGHTALGAAGVLGGLLVLSNKARAGQHDLYECFYRTEHIKKCAYGGFCPYSVQSCGGCPSYFCCKLTSKTIIGTC
jgi:hypothetical protein